jgi:thioredoxin-like negative regulator of GroEL
MAEATANMMICYKGQDAINHLEKIVQKSPVDTKARFMLGNQYHQQGRYVEASDQFLKTAILAPIFSERKYVSLAKSLYNSFLSRIR